MHILLDEKIPRKLKGLFDVDYKVQTVQDCVYEGKKNGELLKLAEEKFDIFITMDKGIHFQQNTNDYDIAIIVLRAYSNRFAELSLLMPNVNEVLSEVNSNEVKIVGEVKGGNTP